MVSSHGHRSRQNGEYEVDFDTNITDLYKCITDEKWDAALEALERSPREAKIWVVRHHDGSDEVMWRFLPLHSACARKPPTSIVSALINIHPEAARCADDQGMYPLHYACGNQASKDVIRLLLVANPQAAKASDPRGMLPIHHLACWGPSSTSVIGMVLVANREVADATDADGKTALDLVREADYTGKKEVIAALERWLKPHPHTKRAPSPDPSIFRYLTVNTKREPSASKSLTSPLRSPTFTGSDAKSVSDESYTKEADALTIARLRKELSNLRTDHRSREQEWEEKMDNINTKLRSKCLEMETNVNDTTKALKEAIDRVQSLEVISEEKDIDLKVKEESLLEKDNRMKELSRQINRNQREYTDTFSDFESERNDLRLNLTEVSEHCEIFKSKADNMSDRLGSLFVSLSCMMEQQSALVKLIEERELREAERREMRRNRAREMLEVEEQNEDALKIGNHREITSVFNKQAKEMDAIAAVIAASRT